MASTYRIPKTNFTVQPPGKARQYLIDNFSFTDASAVCKNGHVLLLYFQNDLSITLTRKAVCNKFGCLPTYCRVRRLVQKTKGMFKADQINRLEDICQTPFVFTPACQPGQESVTNTMECEPSLSVSEAVAVNADKVQEGSDVCSVPEAVAVKPDKGQVGVLCLFCCRGRPFYCLSVTTETFDTEDRGHNTKKEVDEKTAVFPVQVYCQHEEILQLSGSYGKSAG